MIEEIYINQPGLDFATSWAGTRQIPFAKNAVNSGFMQTRHSFFSPEASSIGYNRLLFYPLLRYIIFFSVPFNFFLTYILFHHLLLETL